MGSGASAEATDTAKESIHKASTEELVAFLAALDETSRQKVEAAMRPQSTKKGIHTFECSDGSGDFLEICFTEGETKSGSGTLTFSNTSGTCKYTNPNGEELTFNTATGSFTVPEEGKLAIQWKPVGKKMVKHAVKVVYGTDGKAGTYEPRVEAANIADSDLLIQILSVSGEELLQERFPPTTLVSQIKHRIRQTNPDKEQGIRIIRNKEELSDSLMLNNLQWQGTDVLQAVFDAPKHFGLTATQIENSGLTLTQIENILRVFSMVPPLMPPRVGTMMLVPALQGAMQSGLDVGNPEVMRLLDYGKDDINLVEYLELMRNDK